MVYIIKKIDYNFLASLHEDSFYETIIGYKLTEEGAIQYCKMFADIRDMGNSYSHTYDDKTYPYCYYKKITLCRDIIPQGKEVK